jgi:hypothetical protein
MAALDAVRDRLLAIDVVVPHTDADGLAVRRAGVVRAESAAAAVLLRRGGDAARPGVRGSR